MESYKDECSLLDEDIAPLADLKALRYLSLKRNSSLTGIGVSKLEAFTLLQFLDLSSCSPQILGGLAHLQGLPLQWLRLANVHIARNLLPGMLGLAFVRAHPTELTSKYPMRPSPELVHRLCLPAGDDARRAAAVGIAEFRARRTGNYNADL